MNTIKEKSEESKLTKIIPVSLNNNETENDIDYSIKKRRAAAYARVSTERDEQQSSYIAQIDYYTKMILDNPELVFVQVYTDEGVSGTDTKKRKGFIAGKEEG